MDGYLIRYFLAVAEVGNFSRAAARLNVTQPTLSAGIAKLESQLGARLFERSNRLVGLTLEGSKFLAHARRISREYEAALQDLKGEGKPNSVRLGVLQTVPTSAIENLVVDYQRAHPVQRLEIVDGSERDLMGRLERGRLDLILTILRPGQKRFEQSVCWTEPYVLAVAADHAPYYEDGVAPEELAREWMIIRRQCEALHEVSRYFTEAGVRPPFAFKSNGDDRALALVRADAGVTVAPQSMICSGVRGVRLKDFNQERRIGLVYAGPQVRQAADDILKHLSPPRGLP